MTVQLSLVLGGARSGKSAYAESLVEAYGANAVYVATAAAGDSEMAGRIRDHQSRRGSGWRTVEEPLELAATLIREAVPGNAVLVDCLTLWLANLMEAGHHLDNETADLLDTLVGLQAPVVLVSNQVGEGIVPDNELARRFRDHAGLLHQKIAGEAGQVILVTAGLPQVLKRPS